MNPLMVGAWLIVSSSLAFPYASMHQCETAKKMYDAHPTSTEQSVCVLGSNPMYGDTPKIDKHKTINEPLFPEPKK